MARRLKNFNFSSLSPWYNQPQNLQLAYNNNYITFQFIGITTNRPKEVRYRYLLEGLDENWSSITDKPEATYSNLPHGNYTFKVKAVNSEGYWSEEFNYSFYHSFRPGGKPGGSESLAVISLVIAVYTIMRWRFRQKFKLAIGTF